MIQEVVKTLSSGQNKELTVDFCTEHIFHNYRGKQFFNVVKKLRSVSRVALFKPDHHRLCSYLLCIHSVENDFKREQSVSKVLSWELSEVHNRIYFQNYCIGRQLSLLMARCEASGNMTITHCGLGAVLLFFLEYPLFVAMGHMRLIQTRNVTPHRMRVREWRSLSYFSTSSKM